MKMEIEPDEEAIREFKCWRFVCSHENSNRTR